MINKAVSAFYLAFISSYSQPDPISSSINPTPCAAHWYGLGLHLGVRADLLDIIRNVSKYESKLCKLMFYIWLRDDPSPTFEKLVRALAAVGKRNLAEPLLAARGIAKLLHDH